jgi:DNA-binding transcriptional LysR family regulator
VDRFEDIQAFVAVVEAGSFTAAADRLEVAKSAISRRIASLEERLGAQLLRRTTRRLSLTESGQGFYERSVRILTDLDEAETAVAEEHGELRGSLRVALPLSFGIRHMVAPIAEFNQRHPRIRFDLDLNDRRVDLVEEGADLAIRIGHLEDSSLIARRLFDSRLVVCASRTYLDANGTPQSPADLAEHACLVYGNLADPSKWAYRDPEGTQRMVDVNVAMSSSSGDFLCDAAVKGVGIALSPTFIAGEAIGRGELVPLLCEFGWAESPAWAVYPPSRHLSTRVRAFIDFIVERFAGVPYWDEGCLDRQAISNG